MQTKLIAALIVIVLIPIAVMGWLGLRLADEEQARLERHFDELLQHRLRDTTQLIFRVVAEKRLLLEAETELNGIPDDRSLRQISNGSSNMEQFFLVAEDGRLVFPSADKELSARERSFLERTRHIWEEKALFHQQPQALEAGGDLMPTSLSSAIESGRQATSSGWYTWHWGNDLSLLFWQRLDDGRLSGGEVDRLGVLADIIAILPSSSGQMSTARIRLADSRNRILYQWGGHEPETGESPQATMALAPPLESWRLDYFSDGSIGEAGDVQRFRVISALSVVILVILGIAVYVYRELTRAAREATQRVNFVNQVSHELKTPLTNIRLYAELLAGELPEGDPYAQRIEVITRETGRLSRLIGNVLSFARGKRKALRLHLSSAVLDDCVREVLGQFLPALAERGIAPELALDAPQPFAMDADAVSQIIGNLLNNVEKYAADGKVLRIETRVKDTHAELVVSDAGPGIPRNQRERIFRPFHRVRDALNEGVSGTGIGLSISRELARLHGGDLVLAESTSGASFVLTLPSAHPKT